MTSQNGISVYSILSNPGVSNRRYDLKNLGTMGSVSPQSRVVELLRPVGGGDDDEAVVVGRRQSVEAGEELCLESTRGLVVALPPRAQDRVDLV